MHRRHRQKSLDREQDARLVAPLDGHPKTGGHRAQHVAGIHLRAHDLASDVLARVQVGEQAPRQRRLAGPDIPRYRNESLALLDPVLKVCERALVTTAAEEELRIRTELKGATGQFVELPVHDFR